MGNNCDQVPSQNYPKFPFERCVPSPLSYLYHHLVDSLGDPPGGSSWLWIYHGDSSLLTVLTHIHNMDTYNWNIHMNKLNALGMVYLNIRLNVSTLRVSILCLIYVFSLPQKETFFVANDLMCPGWCFQPI